MVENLDIKEVDQVEYKDLVDIQDLSLWCRKLRTLNRTEVRYTR